jgi:hypothetical protein
VSRGVKIAIGIVVLIVAINIAESGLNSVTGGTPGGPTSSTYATASDGTAAWASLLQKAGHTVDRLRVPPAHAGLTPGETAVVLDPPVVLESDSDALGRFVRAGGRLIVGSADTSWLRPVVGERLRASANGVSTARALAPVPEVAGVRLVALDGLASWDRLGGALPVLGARGRTVAAVETVGRGRVVLLADDSMLQNAYLGLLDNARFGANIAGRPARPVAIFENYHGFGKATQGGFSALPGAWQWLIVLGFLTAIAYMFARGHRLGPPELEQREFDPPRREYVEAMGGILARSKAPAEALAPLKHEVRQRLVSGPATPEQLFTAARARGLTADEAAAAARDALTREDVLPLGRALARLGGTRGRGSWLN